MTTVTVYRKRPVVVKAIRWDGTTEGATTVIDWVLKGDGTARYLDDESSIKIDTLEGTMTCRSGDFVIQGIKGEFYPHAGSFFLDAYEEVLTVEE